MIQLANVKIGKKLGLALGGGVLTVLLLAGLTLWAVQAVHGAMKASENEGHLTTLAEKISADVGAIAQRVATMTLSREAGQEILAQLLAIRADYMAKFDEFRSLQVTQEDKRHLAQAEEAAAQWRSADNQVIALLKAHKPVDAAGLHREQVVLRFNALSAEMASYVKYRERNLARINEQTEALIRWTTWALICFGMVSTLGAAGAVFLLTRDIVKPLTASVQHLGEVAGGDVSRDVPREFAERGDEIGQLANAIQTMSVGWREVLKEFTGGINVLSASSTELSVYSGRMSEGSRAASGKAHPWRRPPKG